MEGVCVEEEGVCVYTDLYCPGLVALRGVEGSPPPPCSSPDWSTPTSLHSDPSLKRETRKPAA